MILTDKTKTWLDLRGQLQSEQNFPSSLFAYHSSTLIYVNLRQSEDYEKISAKYSSRVFLWIRPQYYDFYQWGKEYQNIFALEKAGGPLTSVEPRSWTSIVKEKARLTPPPSPPPGAIDALAN